MKLREVLEQTIPGLGYELVEVEMTPAKIIRIFIDKDGGVTINDCELVSNHLSKLFSVEDIEYNRLEISSPGIERPLHRLQDFIRFTNKLVKIKTHELISGQKVFQGIIIGVENEEIKLKIDDESIIGIDFVLISRARLIFEDKKLKKPKQK